MANKPEVVVGIDPGQRGSICAIQVKSLEAIFYPTSEKPIDIVGFFEQLDRECDIRVIMIEDVHAIPGTAAGSNFKFGYNVGVINALAQVTGHRVDLVPPKRWQKAVGVKQGTKGKDIKIAVAGICDRLYPKAKIRGPKGGLLDGRSDALMIAHYAILKYSASI